MRQRVAFMAAGPALPIVFIAVALVNIAVAQRLELSNDARMQWAQIVTGRLNDWHSPAMTRLWQALTVFGDGPGPMIVFSTLLYWAGLALIAALLMRRGLRGPAWLTIAAGVIGALVCADAISKDGMLTAFFVLGYGVLIAARSAEPPRRWLIAVALVLVVGGALMRHNGAFAAGPVLLLAVSPATLRRPWVSLAVSAAVAAVLVLGMQIANRDVFGASPSRVEDTLLLFDLAGIAEGAGDPQVFGPASRITRRDVGACYSPVMFDALAPWGRCPWFPEKAGAKLLDQPDIIAGAAIPPSNFRALWLRAIARHPGAYLLHRARHMNAELFLFVSIRPRNGVIPVAPEYLHASPEEPLLRSLVKYTAGVVLIPGVVVALGAVSYLLLFLRVRRSEPSGILVLGALAMSASSLLYAASYVLVGVAASPRYFMLTAVLALLALAIGLWDAPVRAMLREQPRLKMLCIALPLLTIAASELGRIFVPVPPATTVVAVR